MLRKIAGKKRLGIGGTRVVYEFGNGSVIKIARSRKGIRCNKMEVTLYQSSVKPIRKHFARIIDSDTAYRWLIMKKYNRKFPAASKFYRRKLKKLVKKLLHHGIIPSKGVGDYHRPYTPNLRLKRNKQIVVIDYGGFTFASNDENNP